MTRVGELLDIYGASRACAAELLCDRHPPDAVAFTVIEPDLSSRDITFGELRDRSARLATGLSRLGIGAGDRVATLMGKSAELVYSVLAIWRLGAVQVPLFTAFAPPAIAMRTVGNGTKLVIADVSQRGKLAEIPDAPWRVITAGSVEFAEMLACPPHETPVAADVFIELFTSGTTGDPKAVPIPLKAVASMHLYQEYGLEHTDADVYWNAADPGWAYGLYYAIIGPLATGRRSLLLRGAFSPALTWSVLERFGVTNFAAGPTVYRALRNSGGGPLALRHCASAGEPLNPDVIEWAREALGVPVLDQYGQTELGMAAGNVADPRPGSMGQAFPGWRVDVLRTDADEPADAGEAGRVAVELAGSPLMWFTGYRDAPERTADRFTPDGKWYLTGDVATKDADGYLYFASRDDDVILMAGYRIGPFEVESVLLRHPDVAEAAVVGLPDALRGEVLAAYVVLRDGIGGSEELVTQLQNLVRTQFAAHAYPRQVHFTEALPKTPSGKVQRFVLRERARDAV